MSYGYQAFKGTPRLVYRVDARTGKEELVRGVELVGTPLSSVNKVMATATRREGLQRLLRRGERLRAGVDRRARRARRRDRAAAGRAASERSPILPAPWSEAERPRPRRRRGAPGVAP